MKKDIKVEILREKNLNKIETMIEEQGKYQVLSYFAPFYDRRTYFRIDDLGNIYIKEYNPILILFAFSDNKKKLAEYLLRYSYPEEKQNLKKIDRNSNLSIETLRKNLIKTMLSGSLNFSKTFAKELYLKSEKDFFEVLYTFSLMGNPNNLKLFFVYALEKIFKEFKYDDNILYIVISYLTKVRDEYSIYINSSNEVCEIDLENINNDKKIYIKIFNKIINSYSFKNINKFKNSLNAYFKDDFILNSELKEILLGVEV